MLRKIASLRVYLFAIAAGGATSAAAYGIDSFLARIKLPAEATIFDDTILGILVAVMVIGIQRQSELREYRHKSAVIAEMNHHIRNALQIIIYSASKASASDRDEADELRDAVKRIEWALREVLPAVLSDTENSTMWPPVQPKNSH